MHNILITGSTGFVGQNLINYLKPFNMRFTAILRGEIINELCFLKADCVVHLAGKAHDLSRNADPEEYDQVNYQMTKSVFNLFLCSSAKKFIFMSSVKAVADTVEHILTENMSPVPLTEYGRSKLKAEQYILSQLLPKGKSVYILRPCMIHGPGNKGNLIMLYKFIKHGIPYPLASFENKRSYLSIENLCFLIEKLINSDNIPSGVYNVADDDTLSTSELVSIIAESLGRKPILWHISQRVIKILAKIGDLFNLPLNSERLKKLTENYVVSNQKIKSAINYEFPISAREGLTKSINSFNV